MRTYNITMQPADKHKEYFYIGVAHTRTDGYRIVKIGTTNNLAVRKKQHRSHTYSPAEYGLDDFEYVQVIKLSAANTKKLEDNFRAQLRALIGQDEIFMRNDRFIITHNEEIQFNINVTERKTYTIVIPAI